MDGNLLEKVDCLRLDANRRLEGNRKADLGQFMTSAPVAQLMASLLEGIHPEVRMIDAGAGVGSLSAAAVAELCSRQTKPRSIHVTAYEIDPHLAAYLPDTMALCRSACEKVGVHFEAEV